MHRSQAALAAAVVVFLWMPGSPSADAEPARSALELRRITDRGIAEAGAAIPREAVKVFAYEGEPRAARVGKGHIAIDYRQTGVSRTLISTKIMLLVYPGQRRGRTILRVKLEGDFFGNCPISQIHR